MLLYILSNSSLSVSIPFAHSTSVGSFKKIQNALRSASLSNCCDEFHHFEHTCQDVKLCILVTKHEMFDVLLEEDTILLI